ncbi:hypothetical protein [Paenibacillus tyrfis]|uniref:hypothetical protein n=1 Tax=Paenibacillus tyrfis TaxID=1501230 RepID=UPI00209FCE2A|nr:hypothetical protein [Paenibacillus tyrfis]MCP1312074.1 hypothetical protein [Paenibacillus tyrfis]
MSYYRITKLEMPQAGSWGILQINEFEKTHFRFDIREGKPLLDTSFFADGVENPQEKHKKMDADSDFYRGIQQALEQYLKGLERGKEDVLMEHLKNGWSIEIIGATSSMNKYQFTNKMFSSVFVEVHVTAEQNEDDAWILFSEIFKTSK